MPVEKIVERILREAEDEARKIEGDAQKEIERIRGDEAEQVKSIEEEASAQAETAAREEEQRRLSAADLEFRKKRLAEKQGLIEGAFDRALRKLVDMDARAYGERIGHLLLAAVDTGNEEVIISSRDEERITQKLLDRTNELLVSQGRKGELKLSEERRDLIGGFVLRRGRRETNCSLESIFASGREELEPMIAEKLFSEDE